MSAALAFDTDSGAVPDAGPRMPGGAWVSRPQLRLVPSGADAEGQVRSLHITRRGRLLRAAFGAAVLLVLTWVFVGAVTAGAATVQRVTVTPGQTLSEIAAAELPDLPTREGVAALQLANGLSTSDIHAGQVLTVPVER